MNEDLRSVGSLALSRSWLYELFHKLLGGAPTKELLELAGSPASCDAFDEYGAESEVLADFSNQCRKAAAEDHAVQKLLSEWNELFAGLGQPKVLTWESAAVSPDHAVFGESAIQVKRLYEARGWRAKRQGSVPEDSLTMMLGFLALMAQRDYADLAKGDYAAVTERMGDELQVAGSHIASWLGSEIDRALAGHTSFYSDALRCTLAFVELDVAFMRNAVDWMTAEPEGLAGGLDWGGDAPRIQSIVRQVQALATLQVPFLDDVALVRI